MTYNLTRDEKKFLFNKHKNTSYKEIEKYQKNLKKIISQENKKENKDLDTLFKIKFKNLK